MPGIRHQPPCSLAQRTAHGHWAFETFGSSGPGPAAASVGVASIGSDIGCAFVTWLMVKTPSEIPCSLGNFPDWIGSLVEAQYVVQS